MQKCKKNTQKMQRSIFQISKIFYGSRSQQFLQAIPQRFNLNWAAEIQKRAHRLKNVILYHIIPYYIKYHKI